MGNGNQALGIGNAYLLLSVAMGRFSNLASMGVNFLLVLSLTAWFSSQVLKCFSLQLKKHSIIHWNYEFHKSLCIKFYHFQKVFTNS